MTNAQQTQYDRFVAAGFDPDAARTMIDRGAWVGTMEMSPKTRTGIEDYRRERDQARSRDVHIKAEVHTDDGLDVAHFDAASYFADPETTDEDILALARCGFGGDYPADDVARYFDDKDAGVTELFKHHDALVGTPRETGFECHVDVVDALAWIEAHRPHILGVVREATASSGTVSFMPLGTGPRL